MSLPARGDTPGVDVESSCLESNCAGTVPVASRVRGVRCALPRDRILAAFLQVEGLTAFHGYYLNHGIPVTPVCPV